jgi:hypothetical protein
MCFRASVRNDVNGSFGKTSPHDGNVLGNAVKFLREDVRGTTKPWAIYAGFTAPHYPLVADPKYAALYPAASMPLPDAPLDYLDGRHPVLNNWQTFNVSLRPSLPTASAARAPRTSP